MVPAETGMSYLEERYLLRAHVAVVCVNCYPLYRILCSMLFFKKIFPHKYPYLCLVVKICSLINLFTILVHKLVCIVYYTF